MTPINRDLPSFKGILFDMDGLVLDSEKTYVTAWQLAADALGKTLEQQDAEALFGKHADDVARLLGEILGPEFDRQHFFKIAETFWFLGLERDGMPKMPGIDDLIQILRQEGIPYALATNSDRHYAERCLAAAELDGVFDVFVTRDQVASGKPSPDLFLEASRQLELVPSSCLVLEDSETGLQAARAAGTHPILIQQRKSLRDTLSPMADHVFPDLRAFLTALSATRR